MIQFENAISRYRAIILDELHEKAKSKCWVAGGTLRDYFMGVPKKSDIDLFFPNEEDMKAATMHLLKNKADCIWESDNGAKYRYKGRTLDIVKHYFSDPQAAINEFDFTVSMLAVDRERLYHGETTFIDLSKRQLMFNKITYPASTLSRSFRYYQKGFRMCKGEMAKLYEAIQKAEPVPSEADKQSQDEEDRGSGDTAGFWFGID